jgi:adenylate kinase
MPTRKTSEKGQAKPKPEPSNPANKSSDVSEAKVKAVMDLEVKDAQLIFQSVWQNLESELDGDNMRFPAETFWLNGAPGAGKGTQTDFIMEFRDFTEKPIVVSDLLKSPEARKMMDAGMLAGDREVTELVFRRLLDPIYDTGAMSMDFPAPKRK